MYKNSAKKERDHHDSNSHWKTSIKDTIQWFPFITIIEHTANILDPNKGIITSLLKVFAMFQLHIYFMINMTENRTFWIPYLSSVLIVIKTLI